MTDLTKAAPDAANTLSELNELRDLLDAAIAAEFEEAPRDRLWEQGRPTGNDEDDPTSRLALDERRLAVRGAVAQSWRAIHIARVRLSAALSAYNSAEEL